jgi:hypothetical protein
MSLAFENVFQVKAGFLFISGLKLKVHFIISCSVIMIIFEDESLLGKTPCSFMGIDRRFRGAYCLHYHDDGGSTHL